MGKLVAKLASLNAGLENEDVVVPEATEEVVPTDAPADIPAEEETIDPDTIEGALESDDLMAAEIDAVENASSIQQDLETVDRLEAQATGLEDLATVLDHVNKNNEGGVTESEAVLTEIASDMAVVGTDLKTDEDVVPGLESLIGHQVSTESLKETAKKYWKKIWEFIKSVWERIKAFFGNAESRILTYKRDALKIMKQADKLHRDPISNEIRVNLAKLIIGGDAPITDRKQWVGWAMSNYTKSGKALDSVVSGVVEPLVDISKTVNEKAKAKIASNEDAVSLLKDLNDKVAQMLQEVSRTLGKNGTQFMGNKNLVHNLNAVEALKPSDDPLERAALLRSATVGIETGPENFVMSIMEARVGVMSIAEIRVAAKETLRQLGQLEKMQSGPVKKLTELKFDKLELNIEKDAEQGAAAVKAIMQYGTLIARLSGKVIPTLMNVTLGNAATVLSIARKSAAQYDVK